jgi:hypothetical protein
VAEVVFVVDVAGWAHCFKAKDGMLGDWMGAVTRDVRDATKFEAPGPGKFPRNRTGINYGKGRLMNSVGSSVYAGGTDEIEGHVFVKPDYARYVIHGTKPHLIKPKKPGGYLRFYWFKHAKWMVVRHVNHPGTAANDFMIRGLRKGLGVHGII